MVISSHGEYKSRPELGKQTGMLRSVPGFGGWIKTPANQAFHFYCPHGYILQVPQPDRTPGTRFIVTQWNRINHQYNKLQSGSVVRNYSLYSMDKEAGEGTGAQSAHINANRSAANVPVIDILTVKRDQKAKLKLVFDELKKHNLNYSHIHCFFCRSKGKQNLTHNLALNN